MAMSDQQTIAVQKQTIEQLSAQLMAMTNQLELLNEQVRFLTTKLYGKKSEKSQYLMDGQLIFPGFLDAAKSTASPDIVEQPVDKQQPARRRPSKTAKRKAEFSQLPQRDIVLELDGEQASCSDCGHELTSIGQKLVRQELHYVPAELSVHNIYTTSYECRDCRSEDKRYIQSAKAPDALIPHSYATASTVSHVIAQKYVQALPLYRQEKEWVSLGVSSVDRQLMCSWLLKTADLYLYPMVDYLGEQIKKQRYLHMDETPVQVLNEPGRKNTTKSYMWVLASGTHEVRPIRLFYYRAGRKGEFARDILGDYSSYLHTDAYAGYNGLNPDVKRCYCWSHVRRGFTDVLVSNSNKGDAMTLAKKGLRYCNALFKIESLLKDLPADERKRRRLRQSRRVLDAFWLWAEQAIQEVLPKSKTGKAIQYALNCRSGLEVFLEDGNCSLSNNEVENAIRPFTVGRRNWLFSASPGGAKASAAIYSLVETAKLYNLDIERYFLHILREMPQSDFRTNQETMESLMPWDPSVQAAAAISTPAIVNEQNTDSLSPPAKR